MKTNTAWQNNIQIVKGAVDIKEISKGFSPDKKYIITSANNEKYLLRTGDIKEYERKKIEFQILNEMQNRSVQAQNQLKWGVGRRRFMLWHFSYLEGRMRRSYCLHIHQKNNMKLV